MLRVPFTGYRVTPECRSVAVLSTRSRCFAALVGIGLASALLVASQLRPDPRGWGTHEQIGLPRCTFLAVSGYRCPACGMTTSWALATRGHLASAARAHVVGTLLAGIAALSAAVALVVAARGRWFRWQMTDRAAAALGLLLVAALVLEWVIRLTSV
jgi:hypothetical protein